MPEHRPNIIMITTDQQRCDSLSCYGSTFVRTPHIDRLAREGVLCRRAYVTAPVCVPSRASIFTGQLISRHGVHTNGVKFPDDMTMISHRLSDAGYRTHNIGKMHFEPFQAPAVHSKESLSEWEQIYPAFTGPYHGFQTIEMAQGHVTYGLRGHYGAWVRSQVSPEVFESFSAAVCRSEHAFYGAAYDWHLPTRLHSSTWTADRAVAFLRQHDRTQPFFLGVNFQDPHFPHAVPVDFEERVREEHLPDADFDEGELDDKPPHFAAFRCGQPSGADLRKVTREEARQGRAYYYSLVHLVDRHVGRVLDCLDESGLAENTVVVYLSDHGELLGDHGLWAKGAFHYEALVRVPLIVRWPRGFAGGRATEALTSLADVVPTCLEACGVNVPADMDGRSALGVFRGDVHHVRDHVLIEFPPVPEELDLKTIVTADRKLTWYRGQTYGELYDLERDPREKVNRWHDATYAGDRARLLARIMEDMQRLEIQRRLPRDFRA